MKYRYLFFTLIYLFLSSQLEAQGLGRRMQNTPRQIDLADFSSELTSTERCHLEACRSLNGEAGELENCYRLICDGNFWGKSAIDFKCDGPAVTRGPEVVAVTYARCQVRMPMREFSEDPWTGIEIPISLTEMPEPMSYLDKMIVPSFIKEAHADEDELIPWTANDRADIRAYLSAAANQISMALTNSEIDERFYLEVGAPDSEFRQYVKLAYAVALWGIDFLDRNVHESRWNFLGNSLQYVTPSELPNCSYRSSGLSVDWGPLPYFVPEDAYRNDFVSVLNVGSMISLGGAIRRGTVVVIRNTPLAREAAASLIMSITKTKPKDIAKKLFKRAMRSGGGQIVIPDNLSRSYATGEYDTYGIAASLLSLGFAQHMMSESHEFEERYLSALLLGGDMPYAYADVTTAWIIASIIYHFLPNPVRIPTDMLDGTDILRRIFFLASNVPGDAGPDVARVAIAMDNQAAQRQGSLPLREQVRNFMNGSVSVMRIENQFQTTGGLMGALGDFLNDCGGGDSPDSPQTEPDLNSDRLASPDIGECSGEAESSEAGCNEEGLPPDEGSRELLPEERPDRQASSEEEMSWTDCVISFENRDSENWDIGCVSRCFDSDLRREWPCEGVAEADIESGCSISESESCNEELNERRAAEERQREREEARQQREARERAEREERERREAKENGRSGEGGSEREGSSDLSNCQRGVLDQTYDYAGNRFWPFLGQVCQNSNGGYAPGGSADTDWVGCLANGGARIGWGIAPIPYAGVSGGNVATWGIKYAMNSGLYCLYTCQLGTEMTGFGVLPACWCVVDVSAYLDPEGSCHE